MKSIRQRARSRWTLALLVVLALPGHATEILAPGQVRVVNMIHKNQSGESRRDSEPSLAVDPSDPLLMAATAFTPAIPGQSRAPIYVSTDGGLTWRLNHTIPFNDPSTGTGDITLRFGTKGRVLPDGSGSKRSVLYVAALEKPGYKLRILRAKDFTSSNEMESLVPPGDPVDQPYVQAISTATSDGGCDDCVYVAYNALTLGTNPRSATVKWSNIAAAATSPAGFGAQVRIDFRIPPVSPPDPDPICGNGPARLAVHSDGKVYAAFFRHKAGCNSNMHTSEIVVVRDDHWGARTNDGRAASNAFQDLTDPTDGKPGAKAAASVSIPYTYDETTGPRLGKQRIGDQMSIAVDPSNSSRVYLAWGQQMADGSYGIKVRSSEDKGANWTDRKTVTNATNPSLAVNSHGVVGFLYQQLVSDPSCSATDKCWVTHFERSANDFVSTTDLVLHKGADDVAYDAASRPDIAGPLGEYNHLMAIDAMFYGVFSGNNTPNPGNFPNGYDESYTYSRNHDSAARKLFATDGATPVEHSVDPFFFAFNPPLDVVDKCSKRPWLCSFRPPLARGSIKLQCLVKGCTVADLLPSLCPIAFQCPPCPPGGLCPQYYHLHLDGLKNAWRVGLLDSNGNPVPHRQFATRRGIVVSFRPDKSAYIDGRIGNYLLAFEMGTNGTVGAEYRIKTRLTHGAQPYAPKKK